MKKLLTFIGILLLVCVANSQPTKSKPMTRESNLIHIQPDKPISTITYCETIRDDELNQVNSFIDRNASNGYIVKTSSISLANNGWVAVLVVL
jgi:endo-alpha-1,4-polygalactosaminidase (GH114 family)